MPKTPAWQRKEGQSKSGGLNEKGRRSDEKANPGSDLKPPVSKKKAAKSNKAAKRRKSYCARSKGQMNDHNIDCSKTPEKRILQSPSQMGLLTHIP